VKVTPRYVPLSGEQAQLQEAYPPPLQNINAEIAMISKAIANSETNTIPVGFGKTGADGDRGKTPGWSAR